MGPLDPSTTGGSRLEGTRGAAAQGGAPFSISPDGRWMSFALELPSPGNSGDDAAALAQYELDRLAHFRLYDLKDGRVIRVALRPETETLVRAGGYPLLGAGCWVDGRLLLRTAARRPLVLDPGEKPPTWRPGAKDENVRRCPFPDRRPLKSGDYGPIRLTVGNGDRIVLSDRRNGRELAVHSAGWLPGMEIQVSYLEASPDGRYVAYGVLDHFGSFVGNTTAYVLNLEDGAVRALGSPVLFVRWAPDAGGLFGYAGLAEDGATAYAVYRWRLTD